MHSQNSPGANNCARGVCPHTFIIPRAPQHKMLWGRTSVCTQLRRQASAGQPTIQNPGPHSAFWFRAFFTGLQCPPLPPKSKQNLPPKKHGYPGSQPGFCLGVHWVVRPGYPTQPLRPALPVAGGAGPTSTPIIAPGKERKKHLAKVVCTRWGSVSQRSCPGRSTKGF